MLIFFKISTYTTLEVSLGGILMALIKCPECGRENVSSTAVSCPTCGYGIKEHMNKIEIEKKCSLFQCHKNQKNGI